MQAQECALNQNHNGGIGMRNSLIAAALVLVLGLSAAGCGTQNAGTSAYRWNDSQNNAQTQQELARGPLEDSTGAYHADKGGKVDDFQRNHGAEHAEDGLKKAGEDILNGAKNAGKSIGNAAEDTLDGMTGTPKNSSR